MSRPRKWTDAQLLNAIEKAASWSDALRALGLAHGGATMAAVVRRANEIGCDVAHLKPVAVPKARAVPESKRLTELDSSVDGATLAARSASWAEMMRGYGIPYSSSTLKHFRKLVALEGIDTTHFTQSVVRALTSNQDELGLNSSNAQFLRRAAASMATAWFMERGHGVSIPLEPLKYDLIVDISGRLLRIQVKSTTVTTPSGNFRARITRNTWRSGGWAQLPYEVDDFDQVFIVCGDGSLYLIPFDLVIGQPEIALGKKFESFKVRGSTLRESPTGTPESAFAEVI